MVEYIIPVKFGTGIHSDVSILEALARSQSVFPSIMLAFLTRMWEAVALFTPATSLSQALTLRLACKLSFTWSTITESPLGR